MRRVGSGRPEPLGLTLERGGANIAVFSAHADAVLLCLFDAASGTETERIALPERTGDIFHGFVAGIAAGDRYGLRGVGPYDPQHGHRFNPAKLLVDPYARAIDRPFALHPAMFGETPDGKARDDTDSALVVPKGIAMPPATLAAARRPRIPWRDTVLYELHVRGYTRAHPEVPETIRGTCAGLAHPAALAHLQRLAITTVELMPVAAAIDERHLMQAGLRNYWGYNPVALLTPDPRLAPGGMDELRACVAALQASGIEVVLDVVLNHTGEGDALGPTVSLRGLDNATYYRTVGHDRARYVDDTGCGNTLALDRPPVLRLALDTLRHYAEVAGVDGFRFDLATTLGRRDDAFDPAAPLFQAIAQDPVLRELKLIAEPWDVGPGGYRLGAFPAAWGEWNDRYRDAVRRFWRGDAATLGELATRLAGSADVFGAGSRLPSRSVNFVAAHDGFTLADLVAHEAKHNTANGEENRDGSDANFSWNHGVEGSSDDPAIDRARQRDIRSVLATLLTSRGTPMIAMGDELGRTQRGNNNAYAQDSALTWIDWQNANWTHSDFVATLIELRRRHPALRADRWLNGAPIDDSGVADVEWRRPDGREMAADDWTRADARALVAVLYAPGSDVAEADRVVIALNAGNDAATVHWPAARDGYAWHRRIDTSLPTGQPVTMGASVAEGDTVFPRSVVILVEVRGVGRESPRSALESDFLGPLAAAAGIAADWWDIAGRRHVVTVDTQRALLAAMGLAANSPREARERLAELAEAHECRRLPRAIVGRRDAAIVAAMAIDRLPRSGHAAPRLIREDGTEMLLALDVAALPARVAVAVDGRPIAQCLLTLPPLPAGGHTLHFDDDPEGACRIVVAPDRCYLPADLRGGARRFGLAAHLYALRRNGDQGIGDFTTLGEAGAATARAGGAVVGINPLHALFAADRRETSPYHPSDRRFLDPIYIDVRILPDLAVTPEARALLANRECAIAALSAASIVDYAAVWTLKLSVLEACFAGFEVRAGGDALVAEFERFVAAGGESLRRFAIFEAIAGKHPRSPWTTWPAGLRRPDAPDVADFARGNARGVRFAMYLQWQADRQFAAAAGHGRASGLTLGLYRDLAVGTAPDGAEAWANPAAFARGASIGAPPDPFSDAGQVWDLAPPIPGTLAEFGYGGFRELITANMRHAGALRIDHVMGLSRLFWIPEGAPAAAGAYVRYPLDDLLGVLALESDRARCVVVGEDLGTVPEGFRERLDAADVLSYRVLWFERDGARFKDPARYPAKAAACVSTHDLPTIAGWWNGTDIDENHALGLLGDEATARRRDGRTSEKRMLTAALEETGAAARDAIDPASPHGVEITAAVHRYACATSSALVLVQADDLAGETTALNLPGTHRERPNWCRKVTIAADALWETSAGTSAAIDFRSTRGGEIR